MPRAPTHAGVRRAIERHVAAGWAGPPVAYENRRFTPPQDGRWLRLTVEPGSARIVALERRPLWRHEGQAVVACHTPKGVGAVEALALADRVVALFRGRAVGPARFRAPSVDLDGRDRASFRAVVTLPFWWDRLD